MLTGSGSRDVVQGPELRGHRLAGDGAVLGEVLLGNMFVPDHNVR